MRLVDTSAWIEWLIGSPTVRRIEALLPPKDEWLVPTIVQLELAKWLHREKGEDIADKVVAFATQGVVANLDFHLALAAAEACLTFHLAIADAIIFATARSSKPIC